MNYQVLDILDIFYLLSYKKNVLPTHRDKAIIIYHLVTPQLNIEIALERVPKSKQLVLRNFD